MEARGHCIVSIFFFLFLLGNYTYSVLDVKMIEIKIQLISAFAEIQPLMQLVRNSSPIIPWNTSICNDEGISFIPRSENK